MISLDEAYKYIKETLTDKRYIHTLGVVSVARKLAVIYNESEEKAEIAALCHDIAKYVSEEDALRIMKENNIILSEDEKNTKELWHAILAPIISKEVLKIDDEEILSAVRWHTTGRENMTKLEKIVYIADMIEPSRVFEGVDEIRNATMEDLDKGVLLGLSQSIGFLLSKGSLIDINSIKARNYLINSMK